MMELCADYDGSTGLYCTQCPEAQPHGGHPLIHVWPGVVSLTEVNKVAFRHFAAVHAEDD